MADDSGGDERGRRAGFLGFVAHEVRNPLSTALWSAELLYRMPVPERAGARGEKLSAMCLRSISRVRQLVEDHFLCERLDTEGIPLRPEPLDVREVLNAAIERRPPDIGEVTIDLGPGIAIDADRVLLDRVLDALVAVAGREGAPVRIEARAEGDVVAFALTGRAGETLEDPVKGSPSDPKGRALALPLARRIAKALGGGLAATDRGYLLSLPRGKAYAARPNPAAHP